MLTHQDIWTGIDRLAASHGYSASGLAIKAGLDPTSFNKSKRISPDGKLRWPSTESLAKVLAATSCTMTDLTELIGADDNAPPSQGIPLIGLAQASQDGCFDKDGLPKGKSWNITAMPGIHLNSPDDLYAIQVNDSSMHPTYRKNDILIISPSVKTRKNDRVIIKTRDGDILIKEVKKKTPDTLALQTLNDENKDHKFDLNNVTWMAKILWVSQ
jgi:phage repressor protein C with HTH and peptisase S24 domain